MAKFIKNIVDRINLANRKGLSPYFSPDQIVAEVHSESMNLWMKYIQEFERTQIISTILDPLRDKETIALISGAGTLVNSKARYKAGVMLPNSDIEVELVPIGQWSDRVNHSVKVPNETYPIGRIDNADIIIRPTSILSVVVHFIKKPTKPVYAYVVSGEDYIYNDATSLDFEWNEEVHDQIMNRVLANLGISQADMQKVQYSNIEQQKEGR